jgi:hypothetical protein
MQNGWKYPDPFMQLPFFEENECRLMKELLPNTTFLKYCLKTKEERRSVFEKIFG